MIPGPIQIIACPHCNVLAKHRTLISGNTFGSSLWTDGKRIAPMLPLPPELVRCRQCLEFYWRTDAEKIGTLGPGGDVLQHSDPAWVKVRPIEEPTEEEYYLAIKKKLAKDPQQEKTLRILAWWQRNDAFRDRPDEFTIAPATGSSRENLVALSNLLDDGTETDLIMKAEVLRELGEFNSAKEILGSVTSSKYENVVRQLITFCERRDICVRKLQSGAKPL